MLGYVCGVSQYPQLFVEYVDIYQMLPHPYLRYSDGGPGDKLIKKMGVRLGKSSLNEDDNNLDKQLSYMNYKKTVRKFHDIGWKTVITLLLMFLCLVMDVVCLSILSSLLKI